VEFTLTFLSFDCKQNPQSHGARTLIHAYTPPVFDWNNSQNGRMLGFIGVLSTLLQGGYVRRAIATTGELKMAQRGVTACVLSLVIMSTLPSVAGNANSPPQRLGLGLGLATGVKFMYLAAAFLAFTSATVVNSLTALASLQCDDDSSTSTESSSSVSAPATQNPQLAKGRALGEFRSWGQLGRAIGPILACASYWTSGANNAVLIVRLMILRLLQVLLSLMEPVGSLCSSLRLACAK